MTIGAAVDELLATAWHAGATDILLTVGTPPRMRVHGSLWPVPGLPSLSPSDIDGLLDELVDGALEAEPHSRYEFDFAVTWRDQARVRGNAFSQRGYTAVALRLIPLRIPGMTELGLPAVVRNFISVHQGLVLVTGPTGSGKSTTLASVVNQINADRPCHIITIEDPIEYVYPHQRAVVSQREVGIDTASFPDAMRSSLREDPDVLLVGEMRDLESIRAALTVAETGHLVLASLHTNDTAQTLTRIVDVFPGDQQDQIRVQLAAALTGVIYQRLLPRIGGGLVAAFEVMIANVAVRNLIKEGKTHQLRNALVTGQRDGMITLEQSLNALMDAGLVTYEDAVVRSLHPQELKPRVRATAGVAVVTP
jgi:twitching motility protein PilT